MLDNLPESGIVQDVETMTKSSTVALMITKYAVTSNLNTSLWENKDTGQSQIPSVHVKRKHNSVKTLAKNFPVLSVYQGWSFEGYHGYK